MDKKRTQLIEKLIIDKSDTQLKGLIMSLLKEFPDMYEHILLWGKNSSPDGVDELSENLALEYWSKAERIIDEFNEYGGGHDRDMEEACDYLEKLCELIPVLSWKMRSNIMDRMLVQYHYGNSGFDDSLTDACFAMCKEREEWLYLAENLLAHDRDWNKKLVMDIYKILGCDEQYLSLRKASLKYGSDYYELVEYYQNKNDMQTAVIYAHKGLEVGGGRADHLVSFLFGYYEKLKDTEALENLLHTCEAVKKEQDDICGRMFGYYSNINDYDNAKRCILKQFEYMRSVNLDVQYDIMKTFLTPADWEVLEPELFLFIKNRDTEGYMRICLQKGLKQEVYDTIIAKASMWNDYLYFADKLKYDFPEKIIEYYFMLAVRLVENGANRKSYSQSMGHFKSAKEIYLDILKDNPRWLSKLSEIRERYKKRRAFIEESVVLD